MPQNRGKQTKALLHLYDVWLHFRDVAYPRGTDIDYGAKKSTKKKMDYIYEPDYVLSSGIADVIYGEGGVKAESKVTKVLKNLIDKGYVGRKIGQSRLTRKPYYYFITKTAIKAIEKNWEQTVTVSYFIEDKILKKMTFEDILSDIYKRQGRQSPLFLKLLSYFEENEEISKYSFHDILVHLDIPRDKMQKTAVVGIRPFTEDEGDILFGMNEEIENIKKSVVKKPWTFLIGASGSGKTSLLRAGLVNQYKDMKVIVVDVKDWKEYRNHMIDKPDFDENTKKDLLNKDHSEFLEDFMKLHKNRSWLLAFDQFEEMFSHTHMTPTEKLEFTLFVQKNLKRSRISFLFSVKETYSIDYTDWRNNIQEDLEKEGGVKSPGECPIKIDKKKYGEIIESIRIHESHRGSELKITEQMKNAIIDDLIEIQANKKRYGLVYLQIVLKNIKDGRAYGKRSIVEWVKDWFSERLESIGGYSDPVKREILLHLSGKREKESMKLDDLLTAINAQLEHIEQEELELTLKILQREKLVEYKNGEWSLVHDFLAENIYEILSEDEREKKRILKSLNMSFEDWQRTDDNRYLLRLYDLDRLNKLPKLSFKSDMWEYIWLSAIQERHFPFEYDKLKEDSLQSMILLLEGRKLGNESIIFLSKNIIKRFIKDCQKREQLLICEGIIRSIKKKGSEVQVALLAVFEEIKLPPSIRIDMISMLKDKDLTSYVREKIVGLLEDQDFDKIIEYLEEDDIPPGVKKEIIILAGKLEKSEYLNDIIPFLRPNKWQVGRYISDIPPSTGLEDTITAYEMKLVESAKDALYNLIEPDSVDKLIPLLEDNDIETTDVLYLLGRTKNQKVVSRIVKEIEKDHAKEAMRRALEKLLEGLSQEVEKTLIEMGLKDILDEWDKLQRMEIEKKLEKISLKLGEIGYRKELEYNKEIRSLYSKVMSIERYNNWEIISTGMKALAEIGGKKGTKAFMNIVDNCLNVKYYTGKYYGWDRVVEVMEDMQNIEVNLELEKCLLLLKAVHYNVGDIESLYGFFYKSGTPKLLPPLIKYIKELEVELGRFRLRLEKKENNLDYDNQSKNEFALTAAKFIFCKLANNKYRKEQIKFLLDYRLGKIYLHGENVYYYDLKRIFYPNLDWNSYIKNILPLLNDDSVIDESLLEYKDEEEYEFWRGRRRDLILEIAKTIKPETIPLDELIVIIRQDKPEDELQTFLEIIFRNPRAFMGNKDLAEELLDLYENKTIKRSFLFDSIFSVMFDISRTSNDVRLHSNFKDTDVIKRYIPVMENMLLDKESSNFIWGLLSLMEFSRENLVPKSKITRLLSNKKVWKNIEKALDTHYDIINELLTTNCTRKDIWEFNHLIDEGHDLISVNALKIISQYLKKSDYNYILNLLNSSQSSIRHETVKILLKLDFNRSVPIIILKSLYEIEIIELNNKAGYKKPSKKQINNMVNQALIKIEKKKEKIFSQWISDRDYNTIFNKESLVASFKETGHSHIPSSYYIDSIRNTIKEIGKRGDRSAIPLLKVIFKWFIHDSFVNYKLFSAAVISLRRLDDDETICYLIMDNLLHAPFEGIQTFLDHDMDELFYLKFKDNESNGIRMLLNVIAERPDYHRKAIRFLSKFRPNDIETLLRGSDKTLIEMVQSGLRERGCNIKVN